METRKEVYRVMGEAIARLRSSLGMSEEQFARVLTVPTQVVKAWEEGMSPSQTKRLAINELAVAQGVPGLNWDSLERAGHR